MNPRLIALSGPLKGSVFPLTEKPLTIGRTADNHICLDDELVGRHHARVWLKETRPYLRDGDSRNGTWVDGRAYLEKFLEHGDRLKLGSSIFLYFELDEPRTRCRSSSKRSSIGTTRKARSAPIIRAVGSCRSITGP